MRVQKLKFFWWNEFTKFLRLPQSPIKVHNRATYLYKYTRQQTLHQPLRCDSHDFLCESFMQKKKIYRSIVVLPSLGPPWSILTVAFLSSSNLALAALNEGFIDFSHSSLKYKASISCCLIINISFMPKKSVKSFLH